MSRPLTPAAAPFVPRTDDLVALVHIAAAGSLSAVARTRGVTASQVARAMDRLEAGYRVRLLHRARSGTQLTAEGRRLLTIAQELLAQSDAFVQALDGGEQALTGTVTIAVSQGLAECFVAPVLPALLQAHPALKVRLVTGDDLVDLEMHGVDLALRTGHAPGEAVVATAIGRMDRGLFASRSYAERHGLPLHPDELRGHVVLATAAPSPFAVWSWQDGQGTVHSAPLAGRVTAGNATQLQALIEAGVGIGLLSAPLVRRAVAEGRVVPVLAAFNAAPTVPLYVVTLPRARRSARVRAVIDRVVQHAASA